MQIRAFRHIGLVGDRSPMQSTIDRANDSDSGAAVKQCGIYAIRNVVTGDRYVGQATNIKSRWKAHRTALANGRASSPRLQEAWDRFGADAFAFEVLEECGREDFDECEDAHMREGCAYNHFGPLPVLIVPLPGGDNKEDVRLHPSSVIASDPRIQALLLQLQEKIAKLNPEQQAAHLARLEAEERAEERAEKLAEAAEFAAYDDMCDFGRALLRLPRGQVPSVSDMRRVQEYLSRAETFPALSAGRAFWHAKHFEQAESLFLQVCDCVEKDPAQRTFGIRSEPYEMLAKLYRRTERCADEVSVLERFSQQHHWDDAKARHLLERLDEARARMKRA